MEGTAVHANKKVDHSKAERVIELEESINYEVTEIGKNKSAMKVLRQKIKDRLNSDTDFAKAQDAVRAAQKVRTVAKKEAYKRDPELSTLDTELSKHRADTRMRQLTLSDALVEFEKITDQKSVQLAGGDLIEFERVAKLKPKPRP